MSENPQVNHLVPNDSSVSEAEITEGVYKELRRIAAARMKSERAGHTLQPTALVHEAYLRLAD